jgi:hypothetical protein
MRRRIGLLAMVTLVVSACAGTPAVTSAPETTLTTTTAMAEATTTSTTAAPETTNPVVGDPTAFTRIAVVGCSQTRDAIAGYNEITGNDLFGRSQDFTYLGGGIIDKWADPDGGKWNNFRQRVVPEIDALWVMLCHGGERERRTPDVATVEGIIDTATGIIGHDVPVLISGLNDWDPRESCRRGAYEESWQLAHQVADAGLATLGPSLGPITTAQTTDGCHGNDEGKMVMGEQMVEFFGG